MKKKLLVLFLFCFLIMSVQVPSYASPVVIPAGLNAVETIVFELLSYAGMEVTAEKLKDYNINNVQSFSNWNKDMNDKILDTFVPQNKLFLDAVTRENFNLQKDWEIVKKLNGVTFDNFTEELNFKKDVLYSRKTNTITKEQLSRRLDMNKIYSLSLSGYNEIIKYLPDSNGYYRNNYLSAIMGYDVYTYLDKAHSKYGANLNLGLTNHKIINNVRYFKDDGKLKAYYKIYDYSVQSDYYIQIDIDYGGPWRISDGTFHCLNYHSMNIDFYIRDRTSNHIVYKKSNSSFESNSSVQSELTSKVNQYLYNNENVVNMSDVFNNTSSSSLELPNYSPLAEYYFDNKYIHWDTMREGLFFNNLDAWGSDVENVDLYQVANMSSFEIAKQTGDIDVFNSDIVSSLDGSGGDTGNGGDTGTGDDTGNGNSSDPFEGIDLSKYTRGNLIVNNPRPPQIIYEDNLMDLRITNYAEHSIDEMIANASTVDKLIAHSRACFIENFRNTNVVLEDGRMLTAFVPLELHWMTGVNKNQIDKSKTKVIQDIDIYYFDDSGIKTKKSFEGIINNYPYNNEMKNPTVGFMRINYDSSGSYVNSSITDYDSIMSRMGRAYGFWPPEWGNDFSSAREYYNTAHVWITRLQYINNQIPLVYEGTFTDWLVAEQKTYGQIRYDKWWDAYRGSFAGEMIALGVPSVTYQDVAGVDTGTGGDTGTDTGTDSGTNTGTVDLTGVIGAINQGTDDIQGAISQGTSSVIDEVQSVKQTISQVWSLEESYFLNKFNQFHNNLKDKYNIDMNDFKRLSTAYKKPFEDNPYVNIDSWYPYIENVFRPISTALIFLLFIRFNYNNVLKILGAATMSEQHAQTEATRVSRASARGRKEGAN